MADTNKDLIAQGTDLILEGLSKYLGLDRSDENLTDTPIRVSRMYREVFSGVENTDKQVNEILGSAFPCKNDHLIVAKDIEAFSLCPHHLLPVYYKMHVAYLPCEKVIGISKLVRIVDILAKRLVLQEQLVVDISTNLMKIEGCLGAACIAEGVHYCMVMRGVRQTQAKTVASSMQGAFLEKDSLKQEFLKLVFEGG